MSARPEGEGLASFPKPDGQFFKVGLGADDDLKALLSFYLKAVTQTAADGSPIGAEVEPLGLPEAPFELDDAAIQVAHHCDVVLAPARRLLVAPEVHGG